jgi:hypothetical protein
MYDLTPQTQGDNLIRQFHTYTTSITKNITFYNARKCALLCVDKIISTYANKPVIFADELLYWTDVKDYLENLK